MSIYQNYEPIISLSFLTVFFFIIQDSCQNGPDTNELLDTPEILQSVQSARVSELRLESLQKLGKQLLDDLPGYDEISAKLANAVNEAEKLRLELTETWVYNARRVTKSVLTTGNAGFYDLAFRNEYKKKTIYYAYCI